MSRLFWFAALGVLLGFTPAAGLGGSAPAWSTLAPDGLVTDGAGILTPGEEVKLEADLEAYRRETSNEIAVVIIPTLAGDPIDKVALDLGRRWGVGTERNNGLLMLVAVAEREIRIEVGYGLEGAVPDLAAKRIIDETIVPAFRAGKYGEGIRAGVAALEQEIGGEYTGNFGKTAAAARLVPLVAWVFIALVVVFGRLLARTRSWWLGGVFGGGAGVFFALAEGAWLIIPLLALTGLVADWLVSRAFRRVFLATGHGGWWYGGGPGGGTASGSGSSFGGGSFGGGGASGKW